MQTVAAYLLERRDGMQWPEAKQKEAEALKAAIWDWMLAKGAKGKAAAGLFDTVDGSNGSFATEEATTPTRSWWLLRLDEQAATGRKFTTKISVTVGKDSVFVYATMEVGSVRVLEPVIPDPRCPKIIRTLLERPGVWYRGQTACRLLTAVHGFDSGEGLADHIKDPDRSLPVVLVTTDASGRVALPELPQKLAMDLAGVANVYLVESDASWAISDGLGPRLWCHSGDVRVYWPRLTLKDRAGRHPFWHASTLRESGPNPIDNRERFRRQLRTELMMRAAAMSLSRPREIDEIRNEAAVAGFADMKAKASSLADYEALANLYARDNEELRSINHRQADDIVNLEIRIVELEEECSALRTNVQNAELRLRYQAEVSEAPINSDDAGDDDDTGPNPGETRFYKKLHDTGSRDVMMRVPDCGCNRWETAHKADKARKGIAHLEGGRTDWKTMQHCASCDGGGMWKVRW